MIHMKNTACKETLRNCVHVRYIWHCYIGSTKWYDPGGDLRMCGLGVTVRADPSLHRYPHLPQKVSNRPTAHSPQKLLRTGSPPTCATWIAPEQRMEGGVDALFLFCSLLNTPQQTPLFTNCYSRKVIAEQRACDPRRRALPWPSAAWHSPPVAPHLSGASPKPTPLLRPPL